MEPGTFRRSLHPARGVRIAVLIASAGVAAGLWLPRAPVRAWQPLERAPAPGHDGRGGSGEHPRGAPAPRPHVPALIALVGLAGLLRWVVVSTVPDGCDGCGTRLEVPGADCPACGRRDDRPRLRALRRRPSALRRAGRWWRRRRAVRPAVTAIPAVALLVVVLSGPVTASSPWTRVCGAPRFVLAMFAVGVLWMITSACERHEARRRACPFCGLVPDEPAPPRCEVCHEPRAVSPPGRRRVP
ncbi:MAG: hypothetical protein KF817_00460 [Phycisphaeraceae bacterium]|nr:hypothetical protein [Phycisphaeraceae bacterium]